MWETLEKGGIMMIPLGICSLIVLTIIIERALVLRKGKIIKPEIVNIIQNISGQSDIQLALSLCRQTVGPLSNILRVGLETPNQNIQQIERRLEEQGRHEIRILQKGLPIIETIAGIAPLLGLLGTVLGMIRVFDVISLEGLGGAANLSAGISEALITTVAGLSIGIFALIFYNYYSTKSEALIGEIELYSAQLLRKMLHVQDTNAS